MAFNERFIKVHKEGVLNYTEIWIDRVTGVNYLFHKDGYGGGLTVLLDSDGKPIVTPPEKLKELHIN